MVTDNMTAEQWELWYASPATEALLTRLHLRRDELLEYLGRGQSISDLAEETAIRTAKVVGEIAGLDYVLDKDFLRFADSGEDAD